MTLLVERNAGLTCPLGVRRPLPARPRAVPANAGSERVAWVAPLGPRRLAGALQWTVGALPLPDSATLLAAGVR